MRSIALDTSDRLFYTQLRASADIYVAPFDAAAGRVKSAPAQPIQRFSGFNWQPEWSADGKYIAFLSQRDIANVGRHTVVIHSIESGKAVREIRPELSYVAFPRWSRNGKQFIARGADLKGRSGIVKFDAATGAAAFVVPNETCSNLPLWAASGRTFYCYKQADKAILEVDAETGLVVKSFPTTGLPADVSADGQYLLHTGGGGLRVLTLATGESREVFRDQPDAISGAVTAIAWAPDNRSIAFSAIIRGEAGIWLISLDGGEPRKIVDVVADSMDERGITRAVSSVRFNATNGYLAYSLGATPERDVWKMENFLSPTTSTSPSR